MLKMGNNHYEKITSRQLSKWPNPVNVASVVARFCLLFLTKCNKYVNTLYNGWGRQKKANGMSHVTWQ